MAGSESGKMEPAPPSFVDMPAELKLKILASLDAKTTQLSRRVCKDFREVVDTHKDSLAKTIRDREIARLQAFVDYHNYDGLDLCDALARWIGQKGICLDKDIQVALARAFCRHYSHDVLGAFERSSCTTIVCEIFQWQLAQHRQDLGSVVSLGFFDAPSFVAWCRRFATPRDVMDESFVTGGCRIFANESKLSSVTMHEHGHGIDDSILRRLLTRLVVGERNGIDGFHATLGTPHMLSEELGVPTIDDEVGAFAYYTTDKTTFWSVLRARQSNPGPLHRAAMLERIFIY